MRRTKRTLCLILIFVMLAVSLPFAARRAAAAADYKAYGIDVSSWQEGADWDQIKASGIDFVIIRIGISGTRDRCFENFYAQAKARDINVGVYIYTYSDTVGEATEDANNVLSWLNGRKLEYPVYYDMEDANQKALTNAERTAMCEAFCSTVQDAGYLAGIYSGRSWFRNNAMLDYSTLRQKYQIWMAIWHDHTEGERDYSGECGMWQYGSKGPQAGINGDCDMDVCYIDYPTYVKTHGLSGYSGIGSGDLKFDSPEYEELFGFTNNADMALTEGGLSISATSQADPFGCLVNIDLSADEYKYFVFEARTTYVGEGRQKVSFYLCAGDTVYDKEDCRIDVDLPESGEYCAVVVDASSLETWNGAIHIIRLDPFNEDGAALVGEGIVVRRLKLCRTLEEARSLVPEPEPEPEPPVKIGDANGDSILTLMDLMALKRFLSSSGDAVVSNCDVNGDGLVNLMDIKALRQLLAG